MTADLSPLATADGAFAMLAIDQRISLETMFADAGLDPTRVAMDAFRADVIELLSPAASAILLERGLVQRGRLPVLPGPPPGRILAAEHLVQERGHGATGSSLDADAPAIAARLGAHALKLMAVHADGTPIGPVDALVRDFVSMAHAAGRLALVEVIVRPADGPVTPAGYLATIATLAGGADLVKVQPPIAAGIDPVSVMALSNQLSAIVPCPWVVLSTGVEPSRFGAVLGAACLGGASGFLAGRAIWGDAVGAPDQAAALRSQALERLIDLGEIVQAHARPWQRATARRTP